VKVVLAEVKKKRVRNGWYFGVDRCCRCSVEGGPKSTNFGIIIKSY